MIPSSSLLFFDGLPALERKCRAIEALLAPHRRVAVAWSAGVDSTFLVWFVLRVLKKEVHVLFVDTPFLSARERQDADDVAQVLGFESETLGLDPLADPLVRANPVKRCYHCKRALMERVVQRAGELGCTAVLEGSHAGDRQGHRPGQAALRELGILSPLAAAGLQKAEIRALSRAAGLPTWDKPSQSCLATRIPYDTPLTRELLSRVDRAEAFLWDLGCRQVRVRVHGDLARIEVNPEAFVLVLDGETRERILRRFRELGFEHVSLDLAGFRSGSWDAGIVA